MTKKLLVILLISISFLKANATEQLQSVQQPVQTSTSSLSFIQHIEVWYKEPIPVCWIQKIYVTSSLGYKPKAFKNSGEVFIGIPRFKRNYSRIRGFANNDIDIRNINKLLRFYGKISSNTESSDGYLRKREKELLSQYQNNNGGKPWKNASSN